MSQPHDRPFDDERARRQIAARAWHPPVNPLSAFRRRKDASSSDKSLGDDPASRGIGRRHEVTAVLRREFALFITAQAIAYIILLPWIEGVRDGGPQFVSRALFRSTWTVSAVGAGAMVFTAAIHRAVLPRWLIAVSLLPWFLLLLEVTQALLSRGFPL